MKTITDYIEESKQSFRIKSHLKKQNDYIDLDLPSGLLWSTCNVGASKPEEYGDYFAWGEIKPKKEYTDDNYIFNDNPAVLSSQNDAATHNLGGEWRMPTEDDFRELIRYTNHENAELNGVSGHKFISKQDDSKWIFIPFAGWKIYNDIYGDKEKCNVWTANIRRANKEYAYYFSFDYQDNSSIYYNDRCNGYSVRGVKNK